MWSIADGQKVGELKLPKNDHVIFMRREDDKILLCSTIEGMIYIFVSIFTMNFFKVVRFFGNFFGNFPKIFIILLINN